MITPHKWGWGAGAVAIAFWGWAQGTAAIHDQDAVTFTHSDRQNKAIQAGTVLKVTGMATTLFKIVGPEDRKT